MDVRINSFGAISDLSVVDVRNIVVARLAFRMVVTRMVVSTRNGIAIGIRNVVMGRIRVHGLVGKDFKIVVGRIVRNVLFEARQRTFVAYKKDVEIGIIEVVVRRDRMLEGDVIRRQGMGNDFAVLDDVSIIISTRHISEVVSKRTIKRRISSMIGRLVVVVVVTFVERRIADVGIVVASLEII